MSEFRCVKTGCDVYVMQTGEFIHGDAYLTTRGDLVIRTSATDHQPIGERRHFTVMDYEHWFDERTDHPGTMIVTQGQFTDHGWVGIEEPKLAAT